MTQAYPRVPENYRTEGEFIRRIKDVVNRIMDGKTNNRGSVTLTAGITTTAVQDVNCTTESVILFMPKTSNASAALASTYISARTSGSFTVTHANNGQTDREFEYTITG